MLILHPKSSCDVCFDTYVSPERVPFAIEKCGHILCGVCVRKLGSQPICPFCRQPFEENDLRRLHVEISPSIPSTPAMLPRTEESMSESDAQAKQYTSRIADIVLSGASAVEVRELIEEIGAWLTTQDEGDYRDLRTSWLLLKKHSQKKSDLRMKNDEVRELESKVVLQERLIENVQKKHDQQKARAVDLEEQLYQLQHEHEQLRSEYEFCMDECLKLKDEVRQLKSARRTSPPPRPTESRYRSYDRDPQPESDAMAISFPKEKAMMNPDMFTLSPIPASAQIDALKSTAPRFRPLTEDSDVEDLKPMASNPYHVRSIQPINIKSHQTYRKPADSHDMDIVPRSFPRSSVDVNMSSASSSPVVSDFRYSSRDPGASSSSNYDKFRRPSVSRRPALDSPAEELNEAEIMRVEQNKKRLEDLFTSPAIMTSAIPAADYSSSRRTHSPDSIPVTRNVSPVSKDVPHSQPPRVMSRASTAAQQAERECEGRNRPAMAIKDPTQSPTSSYSSYQRDIMHPQPTLPQRPPYNRRPSDSGSLRGKANSGSSVSSSSTTMSNLARTLRANHDGQRGQ